MAAVRNESTTHRRSIIPALAGFALLIAVSGAPVASSAVPTTPAGPIVSACEAPPTTDLPLRIGPVHAPAVAGAHKPTGVMYT